MIGVEDLSLGSISKIVQRAKSQPRVTAVVSATGQTFPRVSYQSALLCGSTQLESTAKRATYSKGSRVGILGWQTAERALQCLLTCPILGDLAKWSHWDDVFAPNLGTLREFITIKAAKVSVSGAASLCALESEPEVYLRVDPDSSVDSLDEATSKGEARTAAGHLVSLVIQNGNVSTAPLALVASHMRTALDKLAATAGMTDDSPEFGHQSNRASENDIEQQPVIQFALQLLVLLPHKLAIAIGRQVKCFVNVCSKENSCAQF